MKSHIYEFGPSYLTRLGIHIFVPMLLFAVLMRFGALSGLFPQPWPTLDVDRTILTHQVNASRTIDDSDLLLIGDSSCLMNVSAIQLRDDLKGSSHPRNLGTFMYLGFSGYGALLDRYESVNPGRAQTVVLLVHPEMLRGGKPVSNYLVLLSDLYADADYSETHSIEGQIRDFLGLDIFQGRFLARCPLPLSGEFRHYYGFNRDLYRFLQQHAGSAVDPHRYVPGPGQGNAEYRLASSLESECRTFRAAIPKGAKLLVGLTPVPKSFAAPGHGDRAQQILLDWGQWVGADCLTNLPTVLPDNLFASTTHLNERGLDTYTLILATNLQPYLRQQ